MELTANQLHTFEVLISMKNGAGHIEAQNIMATITGQGLGVQERWDGKNHGRRDNEEAPSFLNANVHVAGCCYGTFPVTEKDRIK